MGGINHQHMIGSYCFTSSIGNYIGWKLLFPLRMFEPCSSLMFWMVKTFWTKCPSCFVDELPISSWWNPLNGGKAWYATKPCQPWSKFQGFSSTSAETWTPTSGGQFEAKKPIMVSKVWSSFSQFSFGGLYVVYIVFLPSDYLWQFAMKWLRCHILLVNQMLRVDFPSR